MNDYNPERVEAATKYKAICVRCGAPLMVEHIAAMVGPDAPFIWFKERHVGQVTLYLCDGCLEFVKEMEKSGIRGQVEKWKNIDGGVISPV